MTTSVSVPSSTACSALLTLRKTFVAGARSTPARDWAAHPMLWDAIDRAMRFHGGRPWASM
ncbi:hypothetical protein [Actinoallomurus sp. NPDC052274]|uniref:hypothetical protein n=1 Tax=Actinoallomurus sp. NPDC052274 TaxID=3155420 RepID=UPI0034166663